MADWAERIGTLLYWGLLSSTVALGAVITKDELEKKRKDKQK